MEPESGRSLRCAIVTPDRLLFEMPASKVIVAGFDDGEVGFLPGHAPYIGALGVGIARVETPEGTQRFGIYGGFVQVNRDVVTLLASEAERPNEVTDESLARDRERLGEIDTRTDEGFHAQERLARRVRTREKLRVG